MKMRFFRTSILLLLTCLVLFTPINYAESVDSDIIIYAVLNENGALDTTYKVVASENDAYEQSHEADYELPWNFSFQYALDGNTIAPNLLGGKTGHLSLAVTIEVNEAVDPSNFTLQLVISMPSDQVKNIDAPGAVVAYNGNDRQIIYTLLPEATHALTLECDVKQLEMSPVYITAMPMSFDLNLPNATETKAQYTQLKTGSTELSEGSASLVHASKTLTDALSQLKNGAKRLQSELSARLSQRQEIDTLIQSNDAFLNQLRLQAEQLEQGMASADPVSLENIKVQYQQVLQTIGLIEANQQVISAQLSGLLSVSNALDQLVDGINALSNGMFTLQEGITKLHAGTTELNKGILLGDTEFEKLFAQLERMEDLSVSNTETLDDQPSQFIIRTPAIRFSVDAPEVIEEVVEPLNFWERILKLFGRI